jgi:cysteinyl-tRNA synthetase
MDQAKNALARMQNAKVNLKHLVASGAPGFSEAESQRFQQLLKYRDKFIAAMDDDLNTADAISAVFELIKDVNTAVREGAGKEFARKCLALLDELTGVLGLLREKEEVGGSADEEVRRLVDERQEARKAKNFARADEIRDILKARGVTLEDTPQGIRIITGG